MAACLPNDVIKLGHLVTRISTLDSLVTVETNHGSFTAPHVILTASIGVLNSGLITFEPPLPVWKTEAFARLEMTSYMKVFVAWETQWWMDDQFDANAYIVPVGGNEDQWRIIKQVHPAFPILQFTATSDEARRVSKLTNDEIKYEITTKLRQVWPTKQVPEPIEILRTAWDEDPLTRGAYSFVPVQTHRDPIGELIKPVKSKNGGTIWFAGEAMHQRYRGYLHSAYLSG